MVVDAAAEGKACRLACFLAVQRIEQALHCGFRCGFPHRFAPSVTLHANGFFDQIANNLLYVAADIADLSEIGCLHLYERRVGQLGQAARNLCLAAARGAYHQDRSEEHTSELQSLMRNSYAVFCLKKTNK